MKSLVLNPSSKFTKNVVRDVLYGCWCKGKRIGGGTVPPFALLEIATILKQDGNEVAFLDAQAEQIPFEKVASQAKDFDAIVISTSTMTFREDADYLLGLKEENPKLTTVIFGSHSTFMPRYCLAHPGIDIIVRHEPEFIIRDLFGEMRKSDGNWKAVRGIGFSQNGEVILNPPYPFINLNDLPFPDVTLLPKDIHYFNPLVRRMPYITTTTSKGCPGRCTFCTAPYFDGKKIRFQSADYILREIEYFIENGYREVYFRDDTFFVNKKRDKELCQKIIEKKLDITWLANARINLIDKETMELAKGAGCHTVKFGVESGVQEILDRMHKGYQIEQAYRVFKWAREVGINTHAHVMLGTPGETLKTLERTIRFVKELNPTTATFGICTPYPGTPLFEEVAKKAPEIEDGSATDLSKLHTEGLFNEYFTDLNREQLKRAVRRAYRKFYLRPSYWVKIAFKQLCSLDDIKRLSIAATNVLDFIFRGE